MFSRRNLSLKICRIGSRFCTTNLQCSSSEAVQGKATTSYTPPVLRPDFTIPTKLDYRQWFPMHMRVQMMKMEGKLRAMDLIIEVFFFKFYIYFIISEIIKLVFLKAISFENYMNFLRDLFTFIFYLQVHDARIPITGRNDNFQKSLYSIRPHILVLNKMDLIPLKKYKQQVEDFHYERGIKKIIWTDCKARTKNAMDDLKAAMLEVLTTEPRYNREQKAEYQVMVVGIPNVGKSSLVNALRFSALGIQKKAVAVGARPGMTVRVQNKVRIMDIPPVYMTDTPGVLTPTYRNIHEAMKLALCDLILQTQTNIYYLADYLLYWLNKTRNYSYVKLLNLPDGPSDDIALALKKACIANDWRISARLPGGQVEDRWDIDGAAERFVQLYREGNFHDACLDKDILKQWSM
ncbi:hypothetical protein WR25_09541 isoform B [Diploscapter pachys]|uniref:G domain-containing protein n=2 Tax=Diploscapter pachys TaxID=2018661 RepID=A0A2A2KX72_9BILA|nr:hypothetical protein WR25_09541 isoform B [Diploscapter pachys]